MNNNTVIIAIVGKSSAGKDTLLNKTYDYFNTSKLFSAHKIISDTTRPKRNNEKDGIDYNFLSEKRFLFKKENNEYLEYSFFRKWYYGTDINQIKNGTINIGVFNVEGLYSLYNHRKDFIVIPVYIDNNILIRLVRSIKREKKFKFEYLRRIVCDEKDFKKIKSVLLKFKYRLDLSNIKTLKNQYLAIFSYVKYVLDNL